MSILNWTEVQPVSGRRLPKLVVRVLLHIVVLCIETLTTSTRLIDTYVNCTLPLPLANSAWYSDHWHCSYAEKYQLTVVSLTVVSVHFKGHLRSKERRRTDASKDAFTRRRLQDWINLTTCSTTQCVKNSQCHWQLTMLKCHFTPAATVTRRQVRWQNSART